MFKMLESKRKLIKQINILIQKIQESANSLGIEKEEDIKIIKL